MRRMSRNEEERIRHDKLQPQGNEFKQKLGELE
jgi:hypothetical protein